MSRQSEQGQAIMLVVVAMGIFLIGALGLAIDGAQLYGHRQMAQAAADAAAQAGILSIFDGTNVGTNAFGSAAHTCSTTDVITPCAYARKNGFGASTDDTVAIDFPSAATVGLDPASLSADDPVNILRVTITRSVHGTLVRMLGAAATSNVKSIAVAAIVTIQTPVPMVITHPSLANSLSTNGNTNIIICGGPPQSIQVNSANASAYASPKAGGTIDLTHAGPADPGNCSTGTGADFGTFGGAGTNPGSVSLGTTGTYRQPSSPVQDPFKDVAAPTAPTTAAPAPITVSSGQYGCTYLAGCTLYSPGLYTGGLNATGNGSGPGQYVLFAPGLYYIRGGGFTMKNITGGGDPTTYNAMCVGCPSDANTGTGMVVYDTGPSGSTLGNDPTGGFNIDTGVAATLQGATITTTNNTGQTVPGPPYYGMLFWEDRNADAHTGNNKPVNGGAHSLGQGNGCFSLLGTIYMTNWLSTMTGDATHYQEVDYNGNPCSTTVNRGYIVVSTLQIVGSTTIRMNLLPYGFINIRQVALVR